MKKIEQLPPILFQEQLKARLAALKTLIKSKKQHSSPAPAGSIRIVNGKCGPQYYLVTTPGDTQGKYLPKKEVSIAKKIIQSDYEKKNLAAMQKESEVLEKVLSFYEKASTSALYEKQTALRKQVIEPVTLSHTEYANRWQSMEYRKKGFAAGSSELLTSTGLRVRSKSEVIIAETLSKQGIPFRYEFPVTIQNGPEDFVDFHPDFYCLNLRTRQEFLWEHFGMMDDPDYAKNAVKKISLYEKNGWFAGKNAVFSFETAEEPLNVRKVREIIENYLE